MIQGLAAIIKSEFYVVARNYTFEVDVTAWGWIHLLVGIVVGVHPARGGGRLSAPIIAPATGVIARSEVTAMSTRSQTEFVCYSPTG